MIERPADIILADADVWTGDAARSWARAVALREGRVIAVGTDEDVRAFKGPRTEVRSLPGRMIVPGFQDAHVHPAFGARNLLNVNLDDLASKDEYLARIEAFADSNPDLDWIVGGGWYSPVFAPQGPRKEDLDAVVPDRPVFLMNSDVHGAWANSKTLAAAGLTAGSPDPWDGYLVRDADGTPTGTLQEGAAYDVLRTVVPAPSRELWMSCLRRAQSELHALGITGWQDAWVEPGLLDAYEALDAAGELTMRVVTALWWDRHRGMEQVEDLLGQRASIAGEGNLHAGTVKIMLDGCPESCTASMLDPYEGDFGAAHHTGIQFVEAESLTRALVRLDALGFQVHQHALGDRAARSALDAVEAARAANGPNDLRHHIAHLQLPDPEDLPRLRRLGVVANMQPLWAAPDPAIQTLTAPRVGDRTARLYPIASIKAHGAMLAFGSDWPVSTPDVLQQLQVAVTRQLPGDPGAGILDPPERIDLHAALSASTRGSAYVNHDDEAGVLAPGMRADLAVLDRNLFDRSLGAIADAQVELTVAAGRVVFEAAP